MQASLRFCSLAVFSLLSLAGCDSFDRSHNADEARRKMVGLPKEQVLACMGVPGKKAHVGSTEVWYYHSTDGSGTSDSASQKTTLPGLTLGTGTHQRYFCDVNIVMVNDAVSAVHYNGPRSGLFARDEQCGFAIEHCVE